MDEAAFIHTIIDNPDDDGPRLVYADWLEERGACARAEFIRVQCEQARLEDTLPGLLHAARVDIEVSPPSTELALSLGPIATAIIPMRGLRADMMPRMGEHLEVLVDGKWFRGIVTAQRYCDEALSVRLRLDKYGLGRPPWRDDLSRYFERAGELLRQYRWAWEEPIQPTGPSLLAKSEVGLDLGVSHAGEHVQARNLSDQIAGLLARRGGRDLWEVIVPPGQTVTMGSIRAGALQCGDVLRMWIPRGRIELHVGDRFNCSWRRGFVEGLACTRGCWLAYWERVYNSMPLLSVCITDWLPEWYCWERWPRIRQWFARPRGADGGFLVPDEFSDVIRAMAEPLRLPASLALGQSP